MIWRLDIVVVVNWKHI